MALFARANPSPHLSSHYPPSNTRIPISASHIAAAADPKSGEVMCTERTDRNECTDKCAFMCCTPRYAWVGRWKAPFIIYTYYVYVYVCICVCLCVYMHMHRHIGACMHTYIHAYRHK